jgi:aminoglycoside/choline kinase family phosphotransferase
MPGAYARVLSKLSNALRKDPNQLLEADEKRDDAESILMEQKGILGFQDNLSGEEAYDSLVYILWR